jgi:hypothetical protein
LTSKLWVYDCRTNQHFTLKQNQLRLEDLAEFVDAYKTDDRGTRIEAERLRPFTYDELVKRDKVSLDIIWLRDDSLEDTDNRSASSAAVAYVNPATGQSGRRSAYRPSASEVESSGAWRRQDRNL